MAFFGLLILVDCILPNTQSSEQINSMYSQNYTWVYIETDDYTYYFPAEDYTSLSEASEVITTKSFLFNEVAALTIRGEREFTYRFLNYRYYFIPAALLFFLPLFIFYYRKMEAWYTVLYMVAYYITPFVLIGFLLVQYRFFALLRLY